MEIEFDLSSEELNIYLAESREQLQVLEEGLVNLEREDGSPDLLQMLFRAAHTLKGSAGIIGHQRKVEVTNSLESALDALRQKKIEVTPELIDVCLDAVDTIRLLVDEVEIGKENVVENLEETRRKLDGFLEPPAPKKTAGRKSASPKKAGAAKNGKSAKAAKQADFTIKAGINPKSIASAARALQLLMALYQAGEVVESDPTMEEIETGKPVSEITVWLNSAKKKEEMVTIVGKVAELTSLEVNGEAYGLNGSAAKNGSKNDAEDLAPDRIGDFLVQKKLISQADLEKVLQYQQEYSDPKPKLGKLIVEMKMLSRKELDGAIEAYISALQKDHLTKKSETVRRIATDKTIRTSVERLDVLVNLVGELITDRNRLFQIKTDMESGLDSELLREAFAQTTTHLGRIAGELQSEVLSIRMLPISTVFNKFPRLVRDLCRKLDKPIDLVIEGEETEVDRTVLDKISDPLIHLIRNSIDHGIESPEERLAAGKTEAGMILLSANQKNGQIMITVKDDGRGIDPAKIRASAVKKGLLTDAEAASLSDEQAVELIFESGLSTAKNVSEISGRGVGLDIVRTNIELLNGTISLDTQSGQGTEFEIIMPLTFEIVPTLLTKVGKTTVAIPLSNIVEVLRIPVDELKRVNGNRVIYRRNEVLRLIDMNKALNFPAVEKDDKHVHVISIRIGRTRVGLIVEKFLREEDLMVKSVGFVKEQTVGVTGASILGDGSVALILDVAGLLKAENIN